MSDEQFETWAVVEVMGHKTYAGMVREEAIGSATFLRIDVPQTSERPAFTKYIGTGSVYAITPTDEATAKVAAERLAERPISPYIVPVTHQLEPMKFEPEEIARAQAWHDQIEHDLAGGYSDDDDEDDTHDWDNFSFNDEDDNLEEEDSDDGEEL